LAINETLADQKIGEKAVNDFLYYSWLLNISHSTTEFAERTRSGPVRGLRAHLKAKRSISKRFYRFQNAFK
jgi:hypothetical protein